MEGRALLCTRATGGTRGTGGGLWPECVHAGSCDKTGMVIASTGSSRTGSWLCIVVTGVGTSWRGMGTTFSFICFVIITVPRRPAPRQGVFGGMMGVRIGSGSLSTLRAVPGHGRATCTEYLGSRGESWGQHGCTCRTRRLCHSLGDAEGGQMGMVRRGEPSPVESWWFFLLGGGWLWHLCALGAAQFFVSS